MPRPMAAHCTLACAFHGPEVSVLYRVEAEHTGLREERQRNSSYLAPGLTVKGTPPLAGRDLRKVKGKEHL